MPNKAKVRCHPRGRKGDRGKLWFDHSCFISVTKIFSLLNFIVWKYHTYYCVPNKSGTQPVNDNHLLTRTSKGEPLPVFPFPSTFMSPPFQLWTLFPRLELKHIQNGGIMDTPNLIRNLSLNVWLRNPGKLVWFGSGNEFKSTRLAGLTRVFWPSLMDVFLLPENRLKGRMSFWQMWEELSI